MKIVYTPEARRDIRQFKQYILENFQNESAAKKLGSKIIKSISILKSNPYAGISLSERINKDTDLMYLIIDKKHIVFYKVVSDEIRVVRIFDTRTDYLNRVL